MKFRIFASLLLAAVLAVLVYLTEAGDRSPNLGVTSSPSSASSADDKVMKNLKID